MAAAAALAAAAPPVGPALAVVGSRRSLQRRWLLVAVVVLLAVGLFVVAAISARSHANAGALQHDGVPAQATVTDVIVRHIGRSAATDGSIQLRYDAAGQTREATVYVGQAIGDYQTGQSVAIVYDAADPARVQVAGRPPPTQGVPVVLFVAIGAALGGMALVALRRAWWMSRLLRRQAWQVVASEILQIPYNAPLRRGSRTLLRLATPERPVLADPVGLNRIDVTFEPRLWVVGLGGERMVLAPVGGRRLLAARRR